MEGAFCFPSPIFYENRGEKLVYNYYQVEKIGGGNTKTGLREAIVVGSTRRTHASSYEKPITKQEIYMEPKLEMLTEKKLIGKRMRMSLSNNKTGELWRSFMPRRKEISNNLTTELFSMQVYDQPVDPGNPGREFDKWAAIEVSDFDAIPDEMEAFVLAGGLYAVFHYTGSSMDTRIFQYIFGTWLPNSNYSLDNRPHFEILGDKYKNADPNSEEDIWIPIKQKDND